MQLGLFKFFMIHSMNFLKKLFLFKIKNYSYNVQLLNEFNGY